MRVTCRLTVDMIPLLLEPVTSPPFSERRVYSECHLEGSCEDQWWELCRWQRVALPKGALWQSPDPVMFPHGPSGSRAATA